MSQLLNLETLSALHEFDEPGKKDFITEIVEAYLLDTENRFKVLADFQSSGNADATGKTAHAIKGSSLNVGADSLAALMKEIELDGRAAKLSSMEKIVEAQNLFSRVRVELKEFLNTGVSQ